MICSVCASPQLTTKGLSVTKPDMMSLQLTVCALVLVLKGYGPLIA